MTQDLHLPTLPGDTTIRYQEWPFSAIPMLFLADHPHLLNKRENIVFVAHIAQASFHIPPVKIDMQQHIRSQRLTMLPLISHFLFSCPVITPFLIVRGFYFVCILQSHHFCS